MPIFRRSAGFTAAATLVALFLTVASRESEARQPGSLSIVEHAIGAHGRRRLQHLEVDCDAVFPVPGRWLLIPAIATEERRFCPDFGDAVANSIVGLSTTRVLHEGWVGEVFTDSMGQARFRLDFSADELARLGADGPWHLSIIGTGLDSTGNWVPAVCPSANLYARTAPWRRDRFAKVYRGELDPYPDYRTWPGGLDSRSGEDLVFTQGWDLVVGTAVPTDSGATRGEWFIVDVSHVFQGHDVPHLLHVAPDAHAPSGGCGNDPTPRSIPQPIPAPAPGTKWILGGYGDPATGRWSCPQNCRWEYTQAMFDHFQEAVRRWPRELAELRALRGTVGRK